MGWFPVQRGKIRGLIIDMSISHHSATGVVSWGMRRRSVQFIRVTGRESHISMGDGCGQALVGNWWGREEHGGGRGGEKVHPSEVTGELEVGENSKDPRDIRSQTHADVTFQAGASNESLKGATKTAQVMSPYPRMIEIPAGG